MDVLKFHNDVYEHLITKGIKFKPRVMKSDRLDKGYWFIGDDTYMNLSFWDGYDQLRKIHRLGFAIDFNRSNEVYLNLSAKDNPEEAKYLNKVAQAIGAKEKYPDLSQKNYGSNIKSSTEFIELLDEFIEEDKPRLDKFISNSSTIKHITLERFNRNIDRINTIRASLGLNLSPISEPIKPLKTLKGRGGVTSKSVHKHIRERIAKKIEVKSLHNQLQNELYKQLDSQYENDKLIMEENWIDLLQVSGGKTYLYEVKPYESPTKCIREGIGQLLHYCSQHFEDSRDIIFVIAGPNNLSSIDKDYLRFIKETLNIETEYLRIEMKNAGI